MARGRVLRLFIGNMAFGKMRHLLTGIDTPRKYGDRKIAAFKPRTDTRSGMNFIKSQPAEDTFARKTGHNSQGRVARISSAASSSPFQMIAFDEVQFVFRAGTKPASLAATNTSSCRGVHAGTRQRVAPVARVARRVQLTP